MPDGSEPWTWWPRFGPADGIPTARQPSCHRWVLNTCQNIEMSIALPYHAWFVGHQTECPVSAQPRRRHTLPRSTGIHPNRAAQKSRVSRLLISCSRPMPDGLVFDRVVKGCDPPDAALLDKYAYTQLMVLRYR